MPYFGDDQPYHASPLLVIRLLSDATLADLYPSPVGMAIGIVLHGCTLLSIYLLISNKLEKTYRQDVLIGADAGLGCFSFFISMNF